MEKVKKLRLKRKLPQQKSQVSSENCKKQNVNEAEAVTVSSGSDDMDVGPHCKQSKLSEPSRPSEETGFLLTNNHSLNNLRGMILALSPRDMDIAKLSPLPAFTIQDAETARNVHENRAKLLQGRLQSIAKFQSLEDIPPFPKICSHFKRRSQGTEIADSDTDIHIESADIDVVKNSDTDIRIESADIDVVKNSDTDIRIESADIDVVKKNHVTDQNTLRLSTTSNDNKELSTSNENERMTSKECIESSTIASSKFKLWKVQTPQTSEPRHENSAVIRDRNSNFYALQSQNTLLRPVSGNSELTVPKPGIEKEKTIQKKYIDKCAISDNMILNVHDSTSYKKDHETASMHKSIPTSNSQEEKQIVKGERTLQNCPLCQMKFDSKYGQMDVDSHIASCLSASEDDVNW